MIQKKARLAARQVVGIQGGKGVLGERLLWVKSSLSVRRKYYHLSGCFRGIPDTRHCE
jgi:hypothetical protein